MFNLRDLIKQQEEEQQVVVSSVNAEKHRKPLHERNDDDSQQQNSDKRPTRKKTKKEEHDNIDDGDKKPKAKRKRSDRRKEGAQDVENGDGEEVLFTEDYVFDNIDDAASAKSEGSEVSVQNYEEVFPTLYEPSSSLLSQSKAEHVTTIQEVLLPTQKAVVPMGKRFKPKVKIVKQRGGKVKVVETAEVIQERVNRQERHQEMHYIRNKWKTRRFDYKSEPDIGRAVELKAKRLVGDRVLAEERQKMKKQRKLEAEKRKAEREARNEVLDDDSLDEQEMLLARLTQNSKEESGPVDEGPKKDLSIPYKQQMDYWEYGHQAPKTRDLQFDFIRDLTHFQQAPAPPLETEDGLRCYFQELTQNKGKPADPQRFYFPVNEPNCPASTDYVHLRNLRSMASRFICGATGDVQMENRLIRLLHTKPRKEGALPVAVCNRQAPLRSLAFERGETLHLYLQKMWKNSEEAARYLGLYRGSSSMTDRSLRLRTIQLHHRNLRTKAQKSMTKGSRMHWLPKKADKDEPVVVAEVQIPAATKEDAPASSPATKTDKGEVIVPEAQSKSLTNKGASSSSPATKTDVPETVLAEAQPKSPTNKDGYSSSPATKTDKDEAVVAEAQSEVSTNKDASSSSPTTMNALQDTDNEDRLVLSAELRDQNPSDNQPNEHNASDPQIAENAAGDGIGQEQDGIGRPTDAVVVVNPDSSSDADEILTSQDDSIQHALFRPTTTFAYVPGTSPPIPPLPLGPLGLVFGPVDRHFKYYHKIHVDDAAYRLTMSSILSRIARCHDESGDHQAETSASLKDQLEQYAREYASLHESNLYKFYVKFQGDCRDIPLVTYSRAFMGVCSVMSNLLEVDKSKEDANTDATNNNNDSLYSNDEVGPDMQIKRVAENLHHYCHKRVQHNGLLRFPRLQLIYALSSLCRQLPAPAAAILSRPTSDGCVTTILDQFQEMLECLEKDDMIAHEQRFYGDTALVAGQLEYMMYKAASAFHKCVKADPLNPDFHLWRVGSLASCLLICSGNLIGNGAHRYPSAKQIDQIMSLDGKKNELQHEIRPMLAKFDEVRIELSQAARTLFTLARHQNSARAHQAVISFLEWKQVVALLARDGLDGHIDEIVRLHRRHTLRCSLETSLYPTSDDHFQHQDRLKLRALALENEPGKIENWRRLVSEIGTLGTTAHDDRHRMFCNECRSLWRHLLFDHQERSDPAWWGKGRDWWVAGLLQLHKSKNTRKLKAMESVLDRLEQHLKSLPILLTDDDDNSTGVVRVSNPELTWLPRNIEVSEPTKIPQQDRSQSYQLKLPPRPMNPPHEMFDAQEGKIELPVFSGQDAVRLELLCYKILIYCKLKCVDPMFLESMIHPLITACTRKPASESHCDEFLALAWLCKIGLDVPRIARDKHFRIRYKRKPKPDIGKPECSKKKNVK